MGKNKGKGKPQPEPEDESGLDGLGDMFDMGFENTGNLNDWGHSMPMGGGWASTIYEEEEYGDEDEDEEDEEPPPPKKGKNKGGQQQQQQQKGGGQQKGNKGNQNQNGGQKGKQQQQQQHQQHQQYQYQQQQPQHQQHQQHQQPPQKQQKQQQQQKGQQQKGQQQKGQKDQKGQKPQQEQTWGTPNNEWGGGEAQGWGAGVGNDWGGGGGGGDWGGGGGGGGGNGRGRGGGAGADWEQRSNHSKAPQGQPTHPLQQQRRLASLLNQPPPQPWTPSAADRGRERANGSNVGSYVQGRHPTPAERVKAAANERAPSRTLLFAAGASSTMSILDGGARGGPHTTVQILESGGVALEEADRALYSRQRPASQRIHWMFSPTKDDRVASLLDWIQAMSHGLATIGLHKFLRTQKRGALMANADYRPWKSPNEPAFDWITFDDVIETHDKTLQESIAYYDPESQVIVFIFLLSRSGNSLAMWRRKLPVPNAVRTQNRAEIAKLTNSLAPVKYRITVDELPPPALAAKPKKKWFNVRW